MADDDTLTTASTYWRDAAVLAETFQQKKHPPRQNPKLRPRILTGMREAQGTRGCVDRARRERITRWTCPKETRHKVDVFGAKTRERRIKMAGPGDPAAHAGPESSK